ncbi:unnamed protein product [Rotaria socialis]|uniref:Uncharacterized protein n=1 Tax=Rotaria socialis TaxID=392032 RepID=A0A821VUE1_9BILA|nr:unnamed protein product [Rotaria socialis]
MTEEKVVVMKPEVAILEIRTQLLKHNEEIKGLQQEFKNAIDKLSSHITSTNNQIDTGLNGIKDEIAVIMQNHTQKLQDETKMIKEQNTNTWTDILKEIQEILSSIHNGMEKSGF